MSLTLFLCCGKFQLCVGRQGFAIADNERLIHGVKAGHNYLYRIFAWKDFS